MLLILPSLFIIGIKMILQPFTKVAKSTTQTLSNARREGAWDAFSPCVAHYPSLPLPQSSPSHRGDTRALGHLIVRLSDLRPRGLIYKELHILVKGNGPVDIKHYSSLWRIHKDNGQGG